MASSGTAWKHMRIVINAMLGCLAVFYSNETGTLKAREKTKIIACLDIINEPGCKMCAERLYNKSVHFE
jgi:hypothetical protein